VRKRIQRQITRIKFRSGDLIKAPLAGVKGLHVCIILKDDTNNGHQECLPVCNLTGSNVSPGEYAIDLTKHDLPDSWFDNKKPTSWLRCNRRDCIYAANLNEANILGNIKRDFSALWADVCRSTINCDIVERLSEACDCEYQEIREAIQSGDAEEYDCGCET